MKKLWQKLLTLPLPLLVVFWVCLAIPVISLQYLPTPKELVNREGLWGAILIAIGYWGLPFVIAMAALTREFSVVPLFLFECVVLLVQSVLNVHALPGELQTLRYIFLLGALAWFALVFLTKDSLYPLLAGNARAWRLSPRLYTQVPLEFWHPDDWANRVKVMMDNCSVHGLGIEMDQQMYNLFFGKKDALGSFIIYLGHGEKTWMLNARILRKFKREDKIFLGMEVLNTEAMRSFIDDIFLKLRPPTLRGWLARYCVRAGVQQAAIALWGISLFGFFMIPSCVSKSRLDPASEQVTPAISRQSGD